MFTKGMKTSNSDEWETPQDIFNELNKEFNFTLDTCANSNNKKCDKFYSIEDDGLSKEWTGVCWCNPPYGRKIGKWVEKAYNSKCAVVMLLPARTDTNWFHNFIYHKAEIRFIKGRLKFNNSKENARFHR